MRYDRGSRTERRRLQGRDRIASYGDNAYVAYPLRVEVARQWIEGHVPLWNPYQRAGAPLLADALSATLYPGNFPFLFTRGDDRYRALELVAVFHYVLAALFMYLFLRTLALAPLACTLGALVYAGNGMITWLTSLYIQAQNTAVWLPLILLALHHATAGRRFWTWSSLGAVAATLQLFAGYPEYSFYSALVTGAYALTLVSRRDAVPWRPLAALAVISPPNFLWTFADHLR